MFAAQTQQRLLVGCHLAPLVPEWKGGIFIFVLFIITFRESFLIIFVIKTIMIILVLICKRKLTTTRRRKVTVITVLRRQDRQRARCNDQCAKNEFIIIVVILLAIVLKEFLHSSFCWILATKSFCWFPQYLRFVSKSYNWINDFGSCESPCHSFMFVFLSIWDQHKCKFNVKYV